MNFLKTNKQSAKIVKKESGTVTIVNVRTATYMQKPVSHLDLIGPDAKTVTITVGGHDYKVGPATIVQTQWDASSQFGANISTKITNIL